MPRSCPGSLQICRELTTLTAASLHGAAYPWHPHNSLSAPTAGEGGIPRSSLALMLHSEAMGVTPGLQHALQLTEIVDVAAEVCCLLAFPVRVFDQRMPVVCAAAPLLHSGFMFGVVLAFRTSAWLVACL